MSELPQNGSTQTSRHVEPEPLKNLPVRIALPPTMEPISSQKGVSEKPYRKKIIEDLGLKFTDARPEQRACSSFGPKAPIQLPSEKPEDFVTRYKACIEDPLFQSIKENEKLASIAQDTFGIKIS